VESMIQRVLLAAAVPCGAIALTGSHLPAAVVTAGLLIAWSIYSAALVSGAKPRWASQRDER